MITEVRRRVKSYAPQRAINLYRKARKGLGSDIHQPITAVMVRHVRRYEWAREMCQHDDPFDVLDAACGSGFGSALLLPDPSRGRYVGVDIDAGAIKEAQREFPDREFIRASVYDLGLLHRFTTVVSFETLEHIEWPMEAMTTFERNLLPGGRLCASIPVNHPDTVYHVRRYTGKEVVSLARDGLALGFATLEFAWQESGPGRITPVSESDAAEVSAGTLLFCLTKA